MSLVSIVITTYNYGRFLGEAIESALGQTHAAVEIIVVDDGSTDDSAAVAARYPVRLLRQSNRGVSRARNRGSAEAAGAFIVFLDADDVLERDYVARCHEALSAEGPRVAYAYTQMRYFGEQNGIHRSGPFSPQRLLAGNLVNASALIRRPAFEEIGGFNAAWTLAHEDWELWVRLLSRGWTGVFVPEPLLRYRRHGSSRNQLSERQLGQLHWRMRIEYPRLYWSDLVRHPLHTVSAYARERFGVAR